MWEVILFTLRNIFRGSSCKLRQPSSNFRRVWVLKFEIKSGCHRSEGCLIRSKWYLHSHSCGRTNRGARLRKACVTVRSSTFCGAKRHQKNRQNLTREKATVQKVCWMRFRKQIHLSKKVEVRGWTNLWDFGKGGLYLAAGLTFVMLHLTSHTDTESQTYSWVLGMTLLRCINLSTK
jgi:hypothetical protein